jgi:hypothetical protein
MAVGNPITELSTTGNFVPVTRTLTINGVSYDLSADRSWSIASPGGGSVTSVALTAPVGFSVSGSPVTSAGTLAITYASGYALPTTVKQSNWDDAYTFVSNFPSQTGNNGKFLYTSGSVLSWQTALQNPMTNYGEMLFGGTSGVISVISPNITTNRQYLQQVGNGTAAFAPSWGGIVSTDISGQAITRVNDTNVTLTLTGTPGNSVLNAVGLTLGWSGELPAGRGGTGTSGVSGIMLGNLTAPVTGITGIGGQLLRANPSTGVYEFFTPPYLESPFTQLGQIIYSGASGQPLALNANSTGNNMYLRSISSGVPAWASIQGGDIVGAGLTSTNDTNVQITLGGTPNNSVLRSVSLTMGWTGQLAVPRGGTGVSTITGVVIGNGTGVMTGVAGTASQLLRRDATNSFYEFFTHNFLSNPMTTLSDIIVANAAGAPIRLAANTTTDNLYLRTVSGAIGYAAIQGSHIVGAGISRTNDTNVQITLGGATTDGLLRAVTLTMGWAGQLAVDRGGTGAATLTGVLIGNGTSAVTGVIGTADQLLRRNAANTAYEFFTPNYLGNPMIQLGDIIYGNASGAPLRLAASSSATNQYLRSVSSGAPGWASIAGTDITGAAITTANDTNILITASGNTSSALLRTLTLTAGWTGILSPTRGGTGASTLTGVVIGNDIGTMVGVAGTADQLLRRNSANSAYEFFTPTYLSNVMTTLGDIITANAAGAPLRLGANATSTNKYLRSVNGGTPSWEEISGFLTGSGTTNYIAKWTPSGTVLGDSQIYDNGSNVGIGVIPSVKLHINGNGEILRLQGVSGGTGNNFIGFRNGTTDFGAIGYAASSANGMYISNYQNAPIYLSTNNILSATIDTTGFVGIGTPTPSQKLSVEGGSIILNYANAAINSYLLLNRKTGQDGGIIFSRDNANDWQQNVDSSGNLYYYSYGTSANAITIQRSTGYLGIGVATPVSHLDVFGSINLRSGYNLTWGGAYGTDIPTIVGVSGSGSNGFLQFYPAGSTSGVKMALRRTGQLALPSYTSSSAFTGTSVATLAVTAAGDLITIAPQQVTASGTYTPTWTGLANVTSVTAFSCQYMRVGDTVTVSGWVTIDPVSDNTPTSLSFSLPINSNTTSVNFLNGTGVTQGGGSAASLSGYGSNFGEFEVIPSLATAVNYAFHFTYRIV